MILEVCPTLVANGNKTGGNGFDASEDGTGRGVPLVTAFEWQRGATQNLDMLEEQSPAPIKSQTPAIAFSIMPMNSGKDYKARETDIAQPIMAGGPVGGNQGGDFIVEPVPFDTTQIPARRTTAIRRRAIHATRSPQELTRLRWRMPFRRARSRRIPITALMASAFVVMVLRILSRPALKCRRWRSASAPIALTEREKEPEVQPASAAASACLRRRCPL